MAFLNCPIELLKVKLQIQDPKGIIGLTGKLEPPVSYVLLLVLPENLIHVQFKGVIDCGIRSVHAQGFMGIYRGMGITLLRDVPGYFAYFGKQRITIIKANCD